MNRAGRSTRAGREMRVYLHGGGQRFEDEDLDGEVGVEMVLAHEADHLASGQLLDLAAESACTAAVPTGATPT
jgi:hypothetical protein